MPSRIFWRVTPMQPPLDWLALFSSRNTDAAAPAALSSLSLWFAQFARFARRLPTKIFICLARGFLAWPPSFFPRTLYFSSTAYLKHNRTNLSHFFFLERGVCDKNLELYYCNSTNLVLNPKDPPTPFGVPCVYCKYLDCKCNGKRHTS